MSADMDCLSYQWVGIHLYFQQEHSFSVRADVSSVIDFLFNHFIFRFDKKENTNYNFAFRRSMFLFHCCRLGWFAGNDCCPISTARWQNESAFEYSPMLKYTLAMLL
jgi:hypothetical protein